MTEPRKDAVIVLGDLKGIRKKKARGGSSTESTFPYHRLSRFIVSAWKALW